MTVPLRPAAMRGDRGDIPLAAHWEHDRVDAGTAARTAGTRDLKNSIVVAMILLVCLYGDRWKDVWTMFHEHSSVELSE